MPHFDYDGVQQDLNPHRRQSDRKPSGRATKHTWTADATDGPRKNGTIKSLVRDKGFGFIRSADGTEYFFHKTATPAGLFDALLEGESVTFQPVTSTKGPRAQDVARG